MNVCYYINYTYFVMTKFTPYKQAAYEQALTFRHRGFTYTEIAKICNVSRGTVSNWLKHEAFSKVVAKDNIKRACEDNKKRLALVNKTRRTERAIQLIEVIRLAEVEYKNYRTAPLFIAGLMLYLSAGDSAPDRTIRLSGSLTNQQAIFIRFATTYLGVPKSAIRFWLHLYPDHDEVTCMKYWSKKIHISPGQFHKNQIIPSNSQRKTLHFGIGNTIIASTLLKKKLLHWIALANKELLK